MHGVGHDGKGKESHQTVVAVCLNEIVSGDSQRINVVLTERSDKCLRGGGVRINGELDNFFLILRSWQRGSTGGAERDKYQLTLPKIGRVTEP